MKPLGEILGAFFIFIFYDVKFFSPVGRKGLPFDRATSPGYEATL